VIIILGGGITGLAAAFELARQEVPFLLLEASDRAGGLILTERVGGFTIDAGPDSLLAQKPAAIELCGELGLAPQLISTTPPRVAYVLKRGRLHALPSPSVLGIPTTLAALARYDLLDWGARARLALEPLIPRRHVADESVGAFFRRRFGAATVGLVAEPLLGGIHAGDIERLSMPSLFPRLVDAERRPGKVLRSLARGRQPTPDGLFRSLRGGMGDLVSAVVSRLPAGALRLRDSATRIDRLPSAGGWRVTTAAGQLDARAVIVATPARVAASLVEGVDRGAAELCASVPYVSTASVALGFRRGDVAHPLRGSGFVVARRENSQRITACTWVSSKWDARAPEGHVLIRAFLGGAHDPDAVAETDGALIEIAARDLAPVLGLSGPPVLARAYRWRQAGAQHHVGHRARMAALGERLRALPGLYVAGSGFASIGIPDCVADGRGAARSAADYVRMER
jgi:oxygen-dependent protoporphyrinogen oxidase